MMVRDYQIFLDDVQHYGRRRSKETILPSKLVGVVDYSPNCGWHKCNDRYFICRNEQVAEDYLLLLTVAGEGVAILDRTEYSLRQKSLMILPKGMRHEYSVPEGKVWEFYWMLLSGVNSEALLKHITDEYGHCIRIDCSDEMINTVELLLSTKYQYYEYEFFAGKLISNMLFALIESLNTSMEDVQKRRTITVKVIEYIEKYFGQPIKLSDISDEIYISTEHLIRVFREEMGMTPYQYLKQYRMQKAFMYLSDPDRSIGDIAASVGYHSLSSFIAQFKESYGITPRKYQRYFVTKPPEQ